MAFIFFVIGTYGQHSGEGTNNGKFAHFPCENLICVQAYCHAYEQRGRGCATIPEDPYGIVRTMLFYGFSLVHGMDGILYHII